MLAADHCTFPASCVAVNGSALLITGASGAGKSELALALIDRGAVLISDDQVALRQYQGRLLAAPAPNIGGLIEVRNLGLVPMAVAGECPVALLIELNRIAPRWIDRPSQRQILGVFIPEVALQQGSGVLAIKAEMALQAYGLNG